MRGKGQSCKNSEVCVHDSQRKCQTVCCFFLSQSSIGLLQREPKPQRSKEQKQVNIRASLLHPSIPFPSPQLQVRATRFPLPYASICSLSPLPSHRGCRFHLPKTSLPFAASLLCSRIPRPLPSSPGRPWPGTNLTFPVSYSCLLICFPSLSLHSLSLALCSLTKTATHTTTSLCLARHSA